MPGLALAVTVLAGVAALVVLAVGVRVKRRHRPAILDLTPWEPCSTSGRPEHHVTVVGDDVPLSAPDRWPLDAAEVGW